MRLLILLGASLLMGCGGDCPPSQVDATLCYSDHAPTDRLGLQFDHNGDGVVGLDDVVLANEAADECREP